MDAQGSVDLHRGIAPQRRQPAGDRAGRSVLFRSREDGRQEVGHVQPAGAAGTLTPGQIRVRCSKPTRLGGISMPPGPWGASEFIAHAGYVGVIAFPYAPKYAIRAGPVMQAVDKLPLGVIDESKGDFRSQI